MWETEVLAKDVQKGVVFRLCPREAGRGLAGLIILCPVLSLREAAALFGYRVRYSQKTAASPFYALGQLLEVFGYAFKLSGGFLAFLLSIVIVFVKSLNDCGLNKPHIVEVEYSFAEFAALLQPRDDTNHGQAILTIRRVDHAKYADQHVL
jgi:hypothetical protein